MFSMNNTLFMIVTEGLSILISIYFDGRYYDVNEYKKIFLNYFNNIAFNYFVFKKNTDRHLDAIKSITL